MTNVHENLISLRSRGRDAPAGNREVQGSAALAVQFVEADPAQRRSLGHGPCDLPSEVLEGGGAVIDDNYSCRSCCLIPGVRFADCIPLPPRRKGSPPARLRPPPMRARPRPSRGGRGERVGRRLRAHGGGNAWGSPRMAGSRGARGTGNVRRERSGPEDRSRSRLTVSPSALAACTGSSLEPGACDFALATLGLRRPSSRRASSGP